MRTTYTTSFRDGLSAIQEAADLLAKAQEQVSSGRRLNALSDDPTSAAAAVGGHAAIGTIDAYTRSADDASSRLTVVDSVLSDVIDKLTYAKTAAGGALGSSVTPQQRDSISNDLLSVRDALVNDLNAKFGGVFVFSGAKATTPPYAQASNGTVSAYQGDASPISVDIDEGRQIQISYDGSTITQGSDSQDVFTTLSALATAVQNGDGTGILAGIDALGRAFDRATLTQTRVGTSARAIDDDKIRLSTSRLQAVARLSKNEDANMAEAITKMTQADTSYRAALGAFATIGKQSLMDYLQ
jgi:flagellar hook-associated protein 3 FlgL